MHILPIYVQVPWSETKHHNRHQPSLWRFEVNELSSSEGGHKTPPPSRSEVKSPDSEGMYMSTEPNPAYGQSSVRQQEVNDYELCDIASPQPQESVYEDVHEN